MRFQGEIQNMEGKGPVVPITSEVNNPNYWTGAVHVYEDYWQE